MITVNDTFRPSTALSLALEIENKLGIIVLLKQNNAKRSPHSSVGMKRLELKNDQN